MSGILFLKTQRLDDLQEFYTGMVGAELWLAQADCRLFRHGNFLFGFCERDTVESGAMLTFFYDTREQVDRIYRRLKDIALGPPQDNDKYNIYQFFAHDPEQRTVEFQYFNEPMAAFRTGEEVLLSRRSVRKFKPREVPAELIEKLVDISRFSPTARNTQPCYFKIVRDRRTLDWLSRTRGSSSEPIAAAPLAVAICSDPEVSKRYEQDGCITACHFMLAAWFYGLGTCWMGGMDREDVKMTLNIPREHSIATVTPLGYPDGDLPTAPSRKDLSWFLRE